MSPKDIDLKKEIGKKTAQTILIIFNILFDIVLIATMFFGVWALHYVAGLLGMESSYFIKILNQVSEIGFIIIYLILAGWGIILIYKLYKEWNEIKNYVNYDWNIAGIQGNRGNR